MTEPEPLPDLVDPDRIAAVLKQTRTQLHIDAAAEVSEVIRDMCRWHIAGEVTETLTVDGSGGTVQLLPTKRLVDVIEVRELGVPVDLTLIRWSRAGYLRRRNYRFTDEEGGLEVDVKHGFVDVPASLSATGLGIACRVLAGRPGVMQELAGSVSRMYASGALQLMGIEQSVLDRYTIPNSS